MCGSKQSFYTVSHDQLLKTLENIGYGGIFHNVMKRYLINWQECERIEDTESHSIIVNFGVPQGTVLGPTVFFIYLNELFNIESEVKF